MVKPHLTYKEALDYIYSFTDYEKKSAYRYASEHFDLGRVERLTALLDNSQDRFKAIHIAGTKGKGSTAAMIASILRAAGYKTGLYTSPHLDTFRDRIFLRKVGGGYIFIHRLLQDYFAALDQGQ